MHHLSLGVDQHQRLGWAAAQVKALAEAIGLLRNHKYDVVLCDFNLGDGKNGQQLLEEAKITNLIGPACAWIMITAEKTTEAVMGAVEYQPDGYLLKPITAAQLQTRLKKI